MIRLLRRVGFTRWICQTIGSINASKGTNSLLYVRWTNWSCLHKFLLPLQLLLIYYILYLERSVCLYFTLAYLNILRRLIRSLTRANRLRTLISHSKDQVFFNKSDIITLWNNFPYLLFLFTFTMTIYCLSQCGTTIFDIKSDIRNVWLVGIPSLGPMNKGSTFILCKDWLKCSSKGFRWMIHRRIKLRWFLRSIFAPSIRSGPLSDISWVANHLQILIFRRLSLHFIEAAHTGSWSFFIVFSAANTVSLSSVNSWFRRLRTHRPCISHFRLFFSSITPRYRWLRFSSALMIWFLDHLRYLRN